ncbi:MAG TPA: hypothetical protein VHE13_01525, partial [Opitutus sp.]|nr:hypothetical protein [Opitutus sp.]
QARRPAATFRCRGSILVIVLITLLFAAAALVAFIDKAGTDLLIEARDSGMNRLRQDAYSALEVTLAVLSEFQQVGGGLKSPAEGWNDPLGFAGWEPREGVTAEVSFEDESGKLSLPHVDAATLKNLFKQWGLDETEGRRLTDALLGWMRKDYVSETLSEPDYDRAALPYAAPLRSLRSFSELAAIDEARKVFYDEQGRPNDLFNRFVTTFSLYDFKQTNINGAPPDVLAALGLLSDSQQKQLSNYLSGTGDRARMGPSFFDSTQQAAGIAGTNALANGFGTQISALRVNITLHEGRTAFKLSAVVAPPNGASIVTETAVSTKVADAGKTAASASTAADTAGGATDAKSPPGSTGSAADAQKLNYPFTLLEIRENAELSAVPPSPPEKPE